MKKQGVTGKLVGFSALAVLGYLALYLMLRPQLPDQLVRHSGPDGVGYSPLWLVVLVIGGAAVISLGIGVIVYRDFTGLGHWNPGPKAIVVCFLAAGFGILSLGVAMLLSVLGESASQDEALPLGLGMLGLLIGFALAAGVLAKALPRAEQETLPA